LSPVGIALEDLLQVLTLVVKCVGMEKISISMLAMTPTRKMGMVAMRTVWLRLVITVRMETIKTEMSAKRFVGMD
jgi:hypothetical protein